MDTHGGYLKRSNTTIIMVGIGISLCIGKKIQKPGKPLVRFVN